MRRSLRQFGESSSNSSSSGTCSNSSSRVQLLQPEGQCLQPEPSNSLRKQLRLFCHLAASNRKVGCGANGSSGCPDSRDCSDVLMLQFVRAAVLPPAAVSVDSWVEVRCNCLHTWWSLVKQGPGHACASMCNMRQLVRRAGLRQCYGSGTSAHWQATCGCFFAWKMSTVNAFAGGDRLRMLLTTQHQDYL